MDYFTHCPIPAKGGKDCWTEPHPASPYGMCEPHWRNIISLWHESDPTVSLVCGNCYRLVHIDPVELDFAVCPLCHKKMQAMGDVREMLTEMEQQYVASSKSNVTRAGVVYYMRFGDRVKIGYTTKLRVRATQVPNDEVVAAEPGTILDERMRHAEFRRELIPGQKEWFQLTPRLSFHMANVRDRYGDPFKVKKGARIGSTKMES